MFSDGMYLCIDSDGCGISCSQVVLIGVIFVEFLWCFVEYFDEVVDFVFFVFCCDVVFQFELLVDVVSLFECQVEVLLGSVVLVFEE